jgi:N utilization substance protein B
MIDRHQARILAMQSLCQLEVQADHFMDELDHFLAEGSDDPAVRGYARNLVRDTWQNRQALDALIQEVAEHWELNRMAAVDRNLIRIAACELIHRPDVPPRVAINEAMEIGKIFGTAESSSFINGILDAVKTKMEAKNRKPKTEKRCVKRQDAERTKR